MNPQELIGYIIAHDLKPDDDVIVLGTQKIYFNRSDALQDAHGAIVLMVKVPYPQAVN